MVIIPNNTVSNILDFINSNSYDSVKISIQGQLDIIPM